MNFDLKWLLVTLISRSRSPKSNQLLRPSYGSIFLSMIKFYQEIFSVGRTQEKCDEDADDVDSDAADT